ncbi:MAG: delta-aminolevulinic acid dehydratase [Cyclobacteriaceae bacterium]|nr:delta-aminolevulinic acid dehydratase [Cyclobacteriaceae bacterium]
MQNREISKSFEALKKYCENEQFKGWDPYDGLNSIFFQKLPIRDNRLIRLAWIQLFKRNPVNLRPIFRISKDFNPKGLGLFLSGYCNLFRQNNEDLYLDRISELSHRILSLESEGYYGSCWGYNFDWQARAFFQPKHTPTVVATSFISYALLDAYDITKEEFLLNTARSACDFILKDLNRTYDKQGNFSFSYSPTDKTQVFNASLLGSKLLSRVYSYTGEEHLINEAKRSVEYCIDHQNENGSWAYGILPFHQWIDNFHSGYNLECISEYQKYSQDFSYNMNLKKGLDYYLNVFFTSEGKSKYYNNKLYPIDIHAPAQMVVTLYRLGELEKNKKLVARVLNWTIGNMQSSKGYFYYQKKKYLSSKIPYMRWAQAWMFYALSFYLLYEEEK